MVKQKIFKQNGYSSLVMAGVLWGLTPFVYKKSLALLSILLFLSLRFTIGAIAMFFADRSRFVKLSFRSILAILGLCILEVVITNYAYSYGIQRTSIIHASLIQLCVPFMVYIFAAVLLKEKVHRIVWLGGALAAAGLAITILPTMQTNVSQSASLAGDVALLIQVASTAIGIVLARKILSQKKHRVPPGQLGFLEYSFAALFFAALLVMSGGVHQITLMNGQAWVWAVAAGILVGALPVRLYYRAIKRLPAERIADANFISPSVAIVTGILLLNEHMTVWSVAGLVLVLFGLLISHKKIHPIYIAHRLNLHAQQLTYLYRIPKKAYQYIRYQ